MAKLRTNHSQNDSGIIYKAGVFAFIIGILYWGFSYMGEGESPVVDTIREVIEKANPSSEKVDNDTDLSYALPTSTTGQIVEHQY